MKKFNFLIVFTLFLNPKAFGQVGINTTNPQATFHIDSSKDNPSTGSPTAGQQANDFMVNSHGQVGIGTTTPDASAMLDITATDKGILVPRVSLTAADMQLKSNVANATGLIVYNVGSPSSPVPVGYNYWDGSKWLKFVTTTAKVQDNISLAFIKTSPTYNVILAKGVDKELVPLTYTYTPTKNGVLNISSYLYCQIDNGPNQSLTNTFFKINVYDNGAPTPTTYLGSATAFNFPNVNNNPASTFIRAVHPVIAGHTYVIRTFAQEGYNNNTTAIKAGTFQWSSYYSYSFIDINYVSDPY